MTRHRQLPSMFKVIDLYWDEGLSQEQIAERYGVTRTAVAKFMLRKGVPRRAWTRAHTSTRDCIECGQPVVKKIHTNNGHSYGRRCEEHQIEYIRLCSTRARRRNRKSYWRARARERAEAAGREFHPRTKSTSPFSKRMKRLLPAEVLQEKKRAYWREGNRRRKAQ